MPKSRHGRPSSKNEAKRRREAQRIENLLRDSKNADERRREAQRIENLLRDSKNADERRREARRVGSLLRDFVDRGLSITPLVTFETSNAAILHYSEPPENPARLKDRLARWLFSKEDPPVDPEPDDRSTEVPLYGVTVPLDKKADEHDHRHFRHFVLSNDMREFLEQYGVPTNFKEWRGFSGIEIMAPPEAELAIQVVKPSRSPDKTLFEMPEEDTDGTQPVLLKRGSLLFILDRRPATKEELSVFEFWVVPDRASPNDTAYLGAHLIARGFTKDDGESKRRLNQTLKEYFLEKEKMRAAPRRSRAATRS